MQKFGDAEKAEVFRGKEAEVINTHLARTGKAVSEFSDEEKESLQADLEAVRNDVPELQSRSSE